MQQLGFESDLKHAYLQLTMADTVLQDSIDSQATMQLREQMRELAYKLRDAANRIVWLSREESVAKRSSYLQVVFESFAYLSGIVLCAAFLMVRLFKGVQEASQAKQLLKQEQELSDLVISNISNQGIVMFDGQLRCLLWNPGMEDLLSIKPDQAVGQRMQDLDRLFAKDDVVGALTQATDGTSSILEDESISSDGHERCLEINCFPVFMAERKLGIAFIRDVTEQWLARKQAERQNFDLEIKVLQRTAALRQAERRLIAAINSASEGFAAFDWTGKLLFANEQIWAAAPVSLWCREEMSLTAFLQCFAMCEGADRRLVNARSPVRRARVRPPDEEGYVVATLPDESRWRHDLRAPDGHHRLQAGGEGSRIGARRASAKRRMPIAASSPWCRISSGRRWRSWIRAPSASFAAARP